MEIYNIFFAQERNDKALDLGHRRNWNKLMNRNRQYVQPFVRRTVRTQELFDNFVISARTWADTKIRTSSRIEGKRTAGSISSVLESGLLGKWKAVWSKKISCADCMAAMEESTKICELQDLCMSEFATFNNLAKNGTCASRINVHLQILPEQYCHFIY